MTSGSQTVCLRLGAARDDREVELPLPAGWDVTVCPMQDRPALTPAAIAKALAKPAGAEPISQAARGVRKAVLLVDDFRRPTPAETLCLAVIDELEAAGLTKQQITIVLGNGAHRPMNRREIRARLGAAVDRVGEVVSHDAYSPKVKYVGLTSQGTPVLVNAAAADADFILSMSTVYPHHLVAWGGGAKMVVPGIAHVSTIHCHHGRLKGGVWTSAPGVSPSRRDLEEAGALLGLNYSLCVVVNSRKEMCGLFAGEPTKAHRRAVAFARKVGDTPMPADKLDLVIANAYPLDGDGTQYSKAQNPVRQFKVPTLLLSDFADPSTYHGLYDGPLDEYKKRPVLQAPAHTDELLMRAPVFFYSPQYGDGFMPPDRSWYGDSDWDRLMADMSRRFVQARVAVLPAAPLQIPRIV